MTSIYEQIQSLQITWRDGLDILIVAVVLYGILRLIRGTRAMQMTVGLMVFGVLYFLARVLDLAALESLSREIFFYLPFALVVLFQNEIRGALAAFGKNPLLGRSGHISPVAAAPVVEAVRELARRRVGALIVIERTQSLRLWINGGKKIDSVVSADLLINVFTPGTPLHDGAVIVQDGRIAAAGVLLPLSANQELKGHGSRHRAALGLSEETDALIVVVSEENGEIALAREGTLRENLEPDELLDLLASESHRA